MYKKIALLSALLCTLTQYGSDQKLWLEIKPSYFLFADASMKQIYDHGGFEIQGSVSVPFYAYCDFYGSLGYRQANGRALNSSDQTSLSVMLADIGFKPVFRFGERFYYFFACGPRLFYLHQNNYSFTEHMVQGGGLGLFANTGLNIEVADSIIVGIFGEYSFEKQTIYPSRQNVYSNGPVQLGGFAFGVSLGYAF